MGNFISTFVLASTTTSIYVPFSPSRNDVASVFEWQALVVDDVKESDIMSGTAGQHLSSQMVKLPFHKPSELAVVSWHWDGRDGVWGSHNICCAIRVARKIGIRYLLIDAISINQNLVGTELLNRVLAFTELYKTIQVIAAYDSKREFGEFTPLHFRYITRRPWIFNEMRAFRHNPTRIVYAGHNNQGTRLDQAQCYFEQEMRASWRGGFTHSVLGVLCKNVGMTSISDFRFIMPSLAGVLIPSFEKMCHNDYLLTTAILCQTHKMEGSWNNEHMNDITKQSFVRYSFGDGSGASSKDISSFIYLDGKRIGKWEYFHNDYMELHKMRLIPEPDATSLIFKALGFTKSDLEKYLSGKELQKTSLSVVSGGDEPQIEYLEV